MGWTRGRPAIRTETLGSAAHSRAPPVTCSGVNTTTGPTDTRIEGIPLALWWTELRYHSCHACFAHTCWEGGDASVPFLDQGHPSRHLPWQESFGDIPEAAEPLLDLWRA